MGNLGLRGEALLTLGEFEGAADALRYGLEKARTLGNPSQLWKSWAALGRMHSAVGADEEALKAFQQALAIVERIAEGLPDDSLREVLLRSRPVQYVRLQCQPVG